MATAIVLYVLVCCLALAVKSVVRKKGGCSCGCGGGCPGCTAGKK